MRKKTSGKSVVSVFELRSDSGQVLDRVLAGELLTITRDGQPVAEMSQISIPAGLSTLKTRATKLKAIDPVLLRNDLEQLVEP
jgi:antitoxin (DNA-binding transcriptional repressor) of toxin-antitoxin stability system